MFPLFQKFEFAYPNGELFHDRSGLLTRRLRELFPGLEPKDAEFRQRDFSLPSQDIQMLFGVSFSQFQSFSPSDKEFATKAASFMQAVTDFFEISQLDRFSFRHVLGRACSTDEEAQKLIWPLVGEDQKAKLAALVPLPSYNSFQAEFSHGNFDFESRISIMHLIPHYQLNVGSIITEKLRQIVLPKVQFSNATIEEVLEYLQIKSRDHDATEAAPAQKGVRLICQPSSTVNEAVLTLDLSNVPLENALRYVADLAGMRIKLGPDAVIVAPLGASETLPHVTVHIQATGQAPIDVADLDVVAFIDNIRNKHTEEILSKLAPHLKSL